MKKHIVDTGSIVITEDDHGNCTVTVRVVDGNVWMTQYEIAQLFGVYEVAVRNNLRAIFKSGMLWEGNPSYMERTERFRGALRARSDYLYEFPYRNLPG